MKTIKGNLLSLADSGEFDVIVHGCNCFCKMGAGIAKEIRRRYPLAYEVDCQTTVGDLTKLGTYTYAPSGARDGKELLIINAYTQYGVAGYAGQDVVDYGAIRSVFCKLARLCKTVAWEGCRVGIPMIGAGLAGGKWDAIYRIIEDEMDGIDITVVEYDGS